MDTLDSLRKERDSLLRAVKPLIKKKERYAKQSDITDPLTAEEKLVNSQISNIFSQINDIVKRINKLKK